MIVGVILMVVLVDIDRATTVIIVNLAIITTLCFGLPLLGQMIQIARGSCFSKVGGWKTTVSRATAMFVV